MAKIKTTGARSLETKLIRLACELREDARRVRADHDRRILAGKLDRVAQLMSDAADLIRRT